MAQFGMFWSLIEKHVMKGFLSRNVLNALFVDAVEVKILFATIKMQYRGVWRCLGLPMKTSQHNVNNEEPCFCLTVTSLT